jgi:hypothetical protein
MNTQPLFAIDFTQVANAGRRTKHQATFPLHYLDYATDPTLRDSAFVRTHLRHHHDQDNLPLLKREVRHWLKAVRFTKPPHINLAGSEIAVGIRADLLDLLKLSTNPHQLEVTANGLIPEYFDFRFGTCVGSLRPGPTAYELLAVINNVPHNGDFGRLMLHLALLAAANSRDLIVLEIHNPHLYQHLQQSAYQVVPGTRHLLRHVAGPGTCPEELRTSSDNPWLNEVLSQVVSMIAPAPRPLVTPRNKRETA